MKSKVIDGKKVSEQLRHNLAQSIESYVKKGSRSPCLSVVLVGDDPASQVYVGHKEKACSKVGIISRTIRLPKDTSEAEVIETVSTLNGDPDIDGILVQLPLPKHIDKVKVIKAIDPIKDVDGLTPYNQGLLAWNLPGHRPCTPAGIMKLLDSIDEPLSGKNAVVIGRSILVGSPIATLLTHAAATVSVLHSKTKNPKTITQKADIVVVAAGVHHLVNSEWLKEGSVVIDVGIHRTEEGLQGDVDYRDVQDKTKAVTPVPGGVGPMTIALLLENCFTAYKMRLENLSF